MPEKPLLRPLDFQPVFHQDQQMWLLRDPLQLTDYQLIIPPALAPLLMFCDGTRDPQEIHRAFCEYVQVQVDFEVVADALAQLDAACLLDNERSRQRQVQLLAEYRAQAYRPPALANLVYPGDADELTAVLDAYGADDNLDDWPGWQGRGIISPHIDYQRGGPVYAKVWRRAETAVKEADLIIIFGTDHNGSPGSITLTHKPYATPYGILPTNDTLIDKLATAIGPENAFAEELHHRTEHSVELSAVWLHYIMQQTGVPPKPMIPVLCGSFHHFVMNGRHPADDTRLNTFLHTLQTETHHQKILVVASVDLAHVGPNFGDNFPIDANRRASLTQSDTQLIQAILQGNANSFYQQIATIQDRNRICGFSSIYLMLRYLGATTGVQVAYEHCPADPQNTSFVSICGLLLK
ncbi:MAG: AmmeMemoRadiSam system protein B [Chloroflexi bacterium]|nr:MAG: AmmeMemoRadiSam system protein B [Chloroflexota bacterium]